MLSIAMITFLNCIYQYKTTQGSFLEFSKQCMHNRLIDEMKKQNRYSSKVIPMAQEEEQEYAAYSEEESIVKYS